MPGRSGHAFEVIDLGFAALEVSFFEDHEVHVALGGRKVLSGWGARIHEGHEASRREEKEQERR